MRTIDGWVIFDGLRLEDISNTDRVVLADCYAPLRCYFRESRFDTYVNRQIWRVKARDPLYVLDLEYNPRQRAPDLTVINLRTGCFGRWLLDLVGHKDQDRMRKIFGLYEED